MKNKDKSYKVAMKLLGTTNILITLFSFIKWALKPQIATKLAEKIFSDKNNKKETKVIAIGFINEFFSKYITFGKNNEEVVKINQIIDKKIQTDNKYLNTLISLRKLRNEIKKQYKTKDQTFDDLHIFGVSGGIATGKVLNINSAFQHIPKNCIGIFPTSGVKFTQQFFKCIGIVFLNGAVTSHGAIIARENNIPAIVYPGLKIQNGAIVTIDGLNGNLKVVDNNK